MSYIVYVVQWSTVTYYNFFKAFIVLNFVVELPFMKKCRLIILLIIVTFATSINLVNAQCSICTKTAGQLGEKSARGLNTGIVYLMLTPFAVAGYIGFRWWQNEKGHNSDGL